MYYSISRAAVCIILLMLCSLSVKFGILLTTSGISNRHRLAAAAVYAAILSLFLYMVLHSIGG